MALAALVAAVRAPMPLAGGVIVLAVSLAWALTRRPPARLILFDDGTVRSIDSAERERTGVLVDTSTNFGWLTVLNMRFEESNPRLQRIVLLRDSLSVDEHRRLQIWLRWVQPFKRTSSEGREP
jgi:hypothetical protein